MFCILDGAWIGKRGDYCNSCKKKIETRLKIAIANEDPEFNGKSYTRAEMKANGHKGLKVRMAMKKELCVQLRDTHYTVPQ